MIGPHRSFEAAPPAGQAVHPLRWPRAQQLEHATTVERLTADLKRLRAADEPCYLEYQTDLGVLRVEWCRRSIREWTVLSEALSDRGHDHVVMRSDDIKHLAQWLWAANLVMGCRR